MHKIPAEVDLILLCSRLSAPEGLQDRIRIILERDICWDKVIKIASSQGVIPFLYLNLKDYTRPNIPEATLDFLKRIYFSNLKKNLGLESELAPVLSRVRERNIDILAFKGFGLIYSLYDNPALRILTDADFLVRRENIPPIRMIFGEFGFTEGQIHNPQGERYSNQICFTKKVKSGYMVFVDVHWKFSLARPYEITLDSAWHRARQIKVGRLEMFCLSNEDSIMATALHIRRQIRELSLKSIVDVAEILNRDEDRLDWGYIINESRNNHAISCVYLAVYLARTLLGAKLCEEKIKEFLPGPVKRALIRNLIHAGNFYNFPLWRAFILRALLFESPYDLLLYFWQVSFCERFFVKFFQRRS